ncbi:hypothetical protein [Brucella haematophila]|uniref:hypothetical protein n=1 Tax=Brucella haematophila TaxID=419474 RepID=UPI004042612C
MRLERAEFGFSCGRRAQREASALVPALTIKAGIGVVATLHIITDIAADTQAGFGARNVEIARAVSIANANIFNGFWLWSNDCIRSKSRRRNHCRRRSNEKCSEFHLVTHVVMYLRCEKNIKNMYFQLSVL